MCQQHICGNVPIASRQQINKRYGKAKYYIWLFGYSESHTRCWDFMHSTVCPQLNIRMSSKDTQHCAWQRQPRPSCGLLIKAEGPQPTQLRDPPWLSRDQATTFQVSHSPRKPLRKARKLIFLRWWCQEPRGDAHSKGEEHPANSAVTETNVSPVSTAVLGILV